MDLIRRAPQSLTAAILVKVTGLALGATAIVALLERGKFARKYGRLVLRNARGQSVEWTELEELVRLDSSDFLQSLLRPKKWGTYWQYYLVRASFVIGVVAMIVLAAWPAMGAGG